MRGALIVGIDHYKFKKLNGCVSDAQRMARLLERDEFNKRNFDIDIIVSDDSENITRKSLREKLEKLFSIPSEIALFYFSGHGTETNLGGYIVTQDAEKYDEGISVTEILQFANNSRASDKVIILDSCYSGHMGNPPQILNDAALIANGVSILTASRSSDKAYQTENGGIFTSLILESLQGGAADILGRIFIPNVYSYVEQALGFFNQRPLFKAHVSGLVSLRDCKPALSLEILHKLPIYFYDQEDIFQLDPSFEFTIMGHSPKNAEILSHFQKLRDARLLIPVGAEHLYDAAINSQGCCLTHQGKYFWYLVKNKLI